ncbi:expressed unknown protein [Seminavis robusta]|uniref:Uncharacterized protein n=1 Tax=Seminavis robusta TaxID=568900 RepID=A0A9N8DCG4_9STRA|nr:expressed unknown protein [Seminavis robusta]|eukprot:Sro33_g021310.1 n/a (404) ;mRNA; r:45438-46649
MSNPSNGSRWTKWFLVSFVGFAVAAGLFGDARIIGLYKRRLSVASLFDTNGPAAKLADYQESRAQHPLEIEFPPTGWLYLEHLPAPGQSWPQPNITNTSSTDQEPTTTNLYHKSAHVRQRGIPTQEEDSSPKESTADWGNPVTITTGVPATFCNEKHFADLMRSIAAQTVLAQEVVMVMSNMMMKKGLPSGSTDEQETCRRIYQDMRHILNDAHHEVRLRLVCVKDRVTAGHARNAIERIASSDIVAYIDSDDMELPHRNALLRQQFTCYPKRVLVLGMLERKPNNATQLDNDTRESCAVLPPDTTRGTHLYDLTFKRQEVLHFWRGLGHGHMAVRRLAVLGQLSHTSMYKAEDYVFIQDVLYAFGRNDDAVIVLYQPMTTYYQRGGSTGEVLREHKQEKDPR